MQGKAGSGERKRGRLTGQLKAGAGDRGRGWGGEIPGGFAGDHGGPFCGRGTGKKGLTCGPGCQRNGVHGAG